MAKRVAGNGTDNVFQQMKSVPPTESQAGQAVSTFKPSARGRRGEGKSNDPEWGPIFYHMKKETKLEMEYLVKKQGRGDVSDLLEELAAKWVEENRHTK